MYLLYEHHKHPETGKILVTDMLLTSYFPGTPRINFKSASEKAIFELCKLTFKDIHASKRSIDMDTKIWSFFDEAGKEVYDYLKASAIASAGLQFQRVEGLEAQQRSGRIVAPAVAMYDAADFFYQQAAPASSGPTKEEIRQKLCKLLGVSETELESLPVQVLKKPYRTAAMRYHPDRNNGDASQMTELNYLWQQWQPYAAP